jgi:hypothetical protein
MKLIKCLLAAAAAAASIAVPMSAQATPTIEILYDGASVGVCADESAICDSASGVLGAVTWVKSIGVFSLTINSGLTKPVVSFPELMDLAVSGTANNTSNVAHTLEVRFSETSFSQGGEVSGSYTNNNTNASGTASAWFGSPSTLFDTANLIGSTSPAPNGGHGTFQGNINASPYSLTSSVFITAAANSSGTLSSDFRMTIPEPGTVALVAFALLGAGLASRRRA